MAFWKPGTVAPGSSSLREDEEEPNLLVYNPAQNLSLAKQRRLLPIFELRTPILYAVKKYQVLSLLDQARMLSPPSDTFPLLRPLLLWAKLGPGKQLVSCFFSFACGLHLTIAFSRIR